MSKLENVKKGDWIIITEVKSLSYPTNIPGTYLETYPYSCNGIPLKILAINPPWLAVTDGRYKGTIDFRYVSWTKAEKDYLKQFEDIRLDTEVENFKNFWYVRCVEQPDKVCPNCGNKLIERKDLITNWELYCKNCHFKGAVHD